MSNAFKIFLTLYTIPFYLFSGSNAQNLMTYPPCATAANIINSCAEKIGAPMTITSVAFSCICFDNGAYVPNRYDAAASACDSFAETLYHTTGNAFIAYIDGFCTDPSYAPGTTSIPSVVTSLPTNPATTASGSVSSASQVSQRPKLLRKKRVLVL
jgi:hypothetical protein